MHQTLRFVYKNLITNLLLTEREGRTGEYWPEVVTVRTEHREVVTVRTEHREVRTKTKFIEHLPKVLPA